MAVFPQVGLDEDISAALAGIDPINHPPSGSNRFATEQDLPAGGGSYTDEQAQDAIAALLAAGSHTGITFTYNDATNTLSAAVTGGGGGSLGRFVANIGDGATLNYTITHGLGTKDVVVQCRAVATDLVVMPDIVMLSTTQVTVSFDVAPATNSIRVVVIG